MTSPLHYHDTETTQSVSLGTVYRQDSTGRTWYYAENGGVAADPGKLMVAATQNAQRINLSFATAPAAGDTSISVTIGTGAETADTYKDGFAVVQDGTGEGILYPIEGHDAIDASSAGTFFLKEDIQVAGAVSETNVDLVKNQYKDVVISLTDQADPPVGVFNVSVAVDAYGMIQTWGPAAVWQDTTNGIGDSLVTGSGTAGQVEVEDAVGEPLVGTQGPVAGIASEYQLVYLKIER